MKDLLQVWGRLAGRTYTAVNTNSNTRDFNDEFKEFARDTTAKRKGRSKRSK